jgi:hypothetical protein
VALPKTVLCTTDCHIRGEVIRALGNYKVVLRQLYNQSIWHLDCDNGPSTYQLALSRPLSFSHVPELARRGRHGGVQSPHLIHRLADRSIIPTVRTALGSLAPLQTPSAPSPHASHHHAARHQLATPLPARLALHTHQQHLPQPVALGLAHHGCLPALAGCHGRHERRHPERRNPPLLVG